MYTSATVNGLHLQVDARVNAKVVVELVDGRELQRSCHSRFVQSDVYDVGRVGSRRLEVVLAGEQRFFGVAQWSGECQYDDITVVAVGVAGLLCLGQYDVACMSFLDVISAVGKVAHGVVEVNPRSAAHSPSRTVLHGKSQTKALRFAGGVLHQTFPFVAQAVHRFGNALPSVGKPSAVEKLYASQPRSGNGLQVGCDSGAVHVAVYIVEPCFRKEHFLWRLEQCGVLRVKRTLEQRGVGYGFYNFFICVNRTDARKGKKDDKAFFHHIIQI